MTSKNPQLCLQVLCALALFSILGILWATGLVPAQGANVTHVLLERSFEQHVRPFLKQNCFQCHNATTATSGVIVDQLDAALEDRHIHLWESVRRKISDATMPPKGARQPVDTERQRMVEWITQALDIARSRPTPKNGIVRRLTVPQYRNTLRRLLRLEDNLARILPPDAISKDGFANNTETLETPPSLMESYLEIAEEALTRSIVNPDSKPLVQNFRVDLGTSINPEPLLEELILGANSALLDNEDYVVTQVTPTKPFLFAPYRMRTKYRFIEGYEGNSTVRDWKDFDSIYHTVFAGMRGSTGYPKGSPYTMVPEGLLLRPAIPNDELFFAGMGNTYGPKANFKISLRELPTRGRFRVTVTAAKYSDGLLLDADDSAQSTTSSNAIIHRHPQASQTLTIRKTGIYQVDVYETQQSKMPVPADPSRLNEGRIGSWSFNSNLGGRLEGDASIVDSPFGRAVSLGGNGSVVIPRNKSMNVGVGDFAVAAWIRPRQLQSAGIVVAGVNDQTDTVGPGWRLEILKGPGVFDKGALVIKTVGPGDQQTKASSDYGSVASQPGIIRTDVWQHIAAVVRRGGQETRLYVNGYPVAKGKIGAANLDSSEAEEIHLGRVSYAQHFQGEIDEVQIYNRALTRPEVQALVQPGQAFALPPPETPQNVTLTLNGRPFSGKLQQPAFLVARFDAGPLQVGVQHTGVKNLDQIVFTPLALEHEVSRRFQAFEKRLPRLGVHLGLRRDCGSMLTPVGAPQTVPDGKLTRFVYEGAISNFPDPDVEKDNVNYLAGIREIGVRSEYTDGRDMPRLLIRSVEFEGPLHKTWPPPSHQVIFTDFDQKSDASAYAREIIRGFATRAYRRPVSTTEESVLIAVFQRSFEAGESFQRSVKDALQVVLTSPQFLFLVEKSNTPEPEPIGNYELASKLSYFLWNGPPDSTTLGLAASSKLREELDIEVARMIEDPRFSKFVEKFTSQWLNLDKFDVLEPDLDQFPKLTLATRAQLRREPIEFLRYLIQKNLPARHLIDSDFIVANEVVADYYGLADRIESGFDFVPIRHKRSELGGVLTQAALMAGLSDGRESNPIKRGAWLARKIIAEPPDDPPPNVPDLAAETEGLTFRERLEQHRNQPGCMQCHTKIDPWGMALEEFDAGGRLKQYPVDARSKLPDSTEVSGVHDLKQYLGQTRIDQVAFSFLKHLITYANGRSLTYSELNHLRQDALSMRVGGYRMRDMIRYVAGSDLLLEK